MVRFAPLVPRRSLFVVCLAALIFAATGGSLAQSPQRPIVDANVNMVRGFTLADGDPYLQRQNEPSIAVSTRNPCHLLGGANDYRAVDEPFDDTPIPPNSEPNISLAGDAWLGLFKSFDCGQKWVSTLFPGYPQDNSGKALELKGHEAGADPTVRAGHNGLFYYSGMVFNRGGQGETKIFVARLIDNNNKERGDPIEFLDVATIDTGTKGQFLDKPWLAVDVPRNSFGPGSTLASGTSSASGSCTVNGRQVPAGNVYMAWARFTGNSSEHSKLMFARSEDCGKTWKTNPISNNQTLSQGANIAVAPHDGTIYLTWREFAGNNKPVNMWVAVSSDGGKNFSNPSMIAGDVKTFDQIKSGTKFRSNALPAITADHRDRVYIAWSATGYAWAYDAGVPTPNADARIVMTVSSDRGKTFSPVFPIDPNLPENPTDLKLRRGHQMMPSLTFAAGKIQAIYYDAREDLSTVFQNFIDDKDVKPGKLRHTIDVRGAQADPAPEPVFVLVGSDSLEISKYRRMMADVKDAAGNVTRESIEVGANPPNLPMYAAGAMPFMGDYIDVSGLAAFPIQTAGGQQVWQPNIGPLDWAIGASSLTTSTKGFPMLPVFHAAWTDNRDVKRVDPNVCTVDPKATGERNANIYTSRLTPGLYVGSPGNTKPLGGRLHPVTKQPTDELIQRGFVVFAQNTTDQQKFYQFTIASQPVGGRASFRQFDKPLNVSPDAPPGPVVPLEKVIVGIPKGSTAARTVYATSTDVNAQILVNIEEVEKAGSAWVPMASGLRGSVLLNPDRTNPKIEDPDLDDASDPTVPKIATDEVHDPSMFEARFYKYPKGTASRMLDVKNPDPENPDPENPDPENPDPENPDPENPDPENPDPENPDPENTDLINPDPENPDPENPDPENPDPENLALLNTAPDVDPANSTITDIAWRVHNAGNTTSAYRFRPSVAKKVKDAKYQLIVTRRYMVPTMTTYTKDGQVFCQPVYKSQNQVLVNIENFQPRTPDPENPDPKNPDPENPDPENPDPENANFFLQPDETATVTLRVFTPGDESNPDIPDSEEEVAGKTAAKAANTGDTLPVTVSTNADLTVVDPAPTFTPAIVRPGRTIDVTFTVANRGTRDAMVPTGIKSRVYFSTDAVLSANDPQVSDPQGGLTRTINRTLPFCDDESLADCDETFVHQVPMPTTPGQYFVFIVTDNDNGSAPEGPPDPENEVFEGDELNNVVVVPISVDAFQLAFVQQPSSTTQDFTMTPPVVVAVTHPDGQSVGGIDVTLAIQNNAGPGGMLLGGTAPQTVGGIATFDGLRIDKAGNGYTLAATAALSTGKISAPFNIEVDSPPVANNDMYQTNEDQALTTANEGLPLGTLANDVDEIKSGPGTPPAGRELTAVLVTGPAHAASFSLQPNGTFQYTPAANYNGADSFTYKANDARSDGNTATVAITVVPFNNTPQATAQGVATNEDTAVPIVLTGTDIETLNANFTFAVATAPTHGVLSGSPPNLTYTPTSNYNGSDSFTFTVTDRGDPDNCGAVAPLCAAARTSAPATVSIEVMAVNDAPVGADDSVSSVAEDSGPRTISFASLLGNDSAGPANEIQTLTIIAVGSAVGGSVTISGSDLLFTPTANFTGAASFVYTLQDNGKTADVDDFRTATATTSFTITAVNDAPVGTNDSLTSVAEDSGVRTISVASLLANDSPGPNESGQTLTITAVGTAVGGSVSLSGTNVLFTPAAHFNGAASFVYTLQDNGMTAGVNDFRTATAPASFTITAVNDAPVGTDDSVSSVAEDSGPRTISFASLLGNDSAGPANEIQTLTIIAVGSAVGGSVTISGSDLLFTPTANFTGAASFVYTLQDNGKTADVDDFRTATATTSFTITAVNDAPVGTNDSLTSVAEDSGVRTISVASLLANDSPGPNESGQTLTITAVGTAVGGSVSLSGTNVLFTPAAHFNGAASFVYTLQDNGMTAGVNDFRTATASASFTITEVNDAPSFTKGGDQAVTPDTAHTIPGWATAISPGPANESAQAVNFLVSNDNSALFATLPAVAPNGTLTFASKVNKTGVATVTVRAHDTGGTANGGADTSAPQTFTITVTLGQIPPDAVNDSATTAEDAAADISVLANDSDANGDALTVTSVTAPAHGSATINADQTIKYTPSLHFTGEDSFSYTIGDGQGGSDTATVTVTVTAVNDSPTAVDDAASGSSGAPININVVGNDTDPDNSAAGTLIASEMFTPAGAGFNIGFANEIARVASTGYLYVSGGRGIAVVNPATPADPFVSTIDVFALGLGAASFHQVNDTTSVVYFRHAANTITAIDGRLGSLTFNKLVGRLQIGGNIQAFAIDEAKGLMYVTSITNASQAAIQSRISVVDVDPAHVSTFNTVIDEITFSTFVRGVIVDSPNDRVYAAADTGLIRVENASSPALRLVTTINATGRLVDVVLFGRVYGYDGGSGRIATYDPTTGDVRTFTVPNVTTGFVAGKRFVLHRASGRLFLRSNGQAGAAGKVVVIDTDVASWPTSTTTANPVIAEVTAVGRDGGSDLVVDQTRNLVIATSIIDNRVTFIDATVPAATMNAAAQAQALPVGSDAELDAASGRLYLTNFAMVQRMSLDPRAVLTPIAIGAESGLAVALPGPGGAPNTNRFFIGRTSLGTGVRKYTIDGTASNLSLAHDVGRTIFIGANTQTNRLYIVNGGANATGSASTPSSVAIVDGGTGGLISTVDVGNSASGIAVNETTNKIYVGNGGNGVLAGGISVIDGVTNLVTPANIPAGVFPANTGFGRYLATLCIGPACGTVNKLFVQANKQTGVISVAVLDGSTDAVTELPAAVGATQAKLIRTSAGLNRVFIGNQTDLTTHDVFVVNGATESKITTLRGVSTPNTTLGTQGYVAIDESRNRVYTLDFLADRLHVLNAALETGCDALPYAPSAACYPELATIATGDGPTELAVDPVANRIYVGNTNDRSLTIIDGATLKVVGTLALPLRPTTLALDASSPTTTYLAIGTFGDAGAMLIADTRGGGTLSVAPDTLTPPSNGTAEFDPDGDGTVQYIPGFAGTHTFKYRVTDGTTVSANEATVTVTVTQPLTITTASLPGDSKGQPYSQTLTATGGTAPYLWNLFGPLPGGLTFNHTTGTISGTLTQAGTFLLTAQLRDASLPQQLVTRDYTLVIGPFEVATTSLPTATLNQSYSARLFAGGSSATPFTWSLASGSNPLPPGLDLIGDTISGIPTQSACASASFTVQATDSSVPPQTATRMLTMFFAGPIRITSTAFNAVALENFSPSVGFTCGSGTRTWTQTGTLPRDVAFNMANGQFTSLPSPSIPSVTTGPKQNGVFPVTIDVSDSSGSDSKLVNINVHAVDQQPSSSSTTTIGGFSNTRIAQTITVGAADTLTSLSFPGLTCFGPAASHPLTVTIQGVVSSTGLPDDTNVLATTTATINGANQLITLPSSLSFAAGDQFAIVASSTGTCQIVNSATTDNYAGGAAFTFTTSTNSWARTGGTADFPVTVFYTVAPPAGPTGPANTVFGGTTRVAQTVTVGATGTLTAVRFQTLSAVPPATSCPVTVQIAGVLPTGAPDDNNPPLATTTLTITNTSQIIPLPEIFFNVDTRFAIVLSSTGACQIANSPTANSYLGGAAFVESGSGWAQPSGTFAPADFPVNTLIQNSSLIYLTRGRGQVRSVALNDGRVLIIGTNGTADVFDPSTGLTTATAPMVASRNDATATLLSGGSVLVVGGSQGNPAVYLASAELYNPASNEWTATTGSMGKERAQHAATLLADGRVLITGGFATVPPPNNFSALQSVEIYDAGTFSSAAPMLASRNRHQATLLSCPPANSSCAWGGKVLVTGGFTNGPFPFVNAEIYNPAVGNTSTTPTGGMVTPRASHTATRLDDGTVFIAGGQTTAGGSPSLASSNEIYSASAGSFANAGAIIAPRMQHTATLLSDNSVLLAGGQRGASFNAAAWASAERFVPGTGSVGAPQMLVTRYDHGAVLLSSGRVAVTSGNGGSSGTSRQASQTIEVYDTGLSTSGTPSIANPNLPEGYVADAYSTVTLIANGGTMPYTFAIVSGALPPGVEFNAGTISDDPGTPKVPGTYIFGVRVTDSAAHSGDQTLTIRINSLLAITTTTLESGFVGRSYVQTIDVAGGVGTRHFSVSSGALPPGLDLGTSGTIQGSPTSTGLFPFTVRVDDSAGHFTTAELSIETFVPTDETAWTTTFPYGGQVEQSGLAVDPSDSQVVYATVQWRGIYRSTDGGEHWANITDHQQVPFDRTGARVFTIGQSGTLYVVVHGIIFKSTDQGASWSQSHSGIPTTGSVQVLVATPAVMYAGTSSDGLYQSADGGDTWVAMSTGLPAPPVPPVPPAGPFDQIRSLAVHPANPLVLYLGTANNGLFGSLDGGLSWVPLDTTFTVPPAAPVAILRADAIAFNPALPDTVFVAGRDTAFVDGVFRSLDGGQTWARLSVNPALGFRFGNLLAIDPVNPNNVYVASYAAVFRSTDGGNTWSSVPASSVQVKTLAIDPSMPQILFAGTEGEGVIKSVDSGLSWTSSTEGIRGINFPHSSAHSLAVDSSNPSVVYAGSINRGHRSADGGQSWQNWNLPNWGASTIATHPSLPDVIFAFRNDLHRSADGGTSWTKLGVPTFCCWNNGDLVIAPSNPQILYFAGANSNQAANGIYKSTDGGDTWVLMANDTIGNGLTSSQIHTLAVDPLDPDVVYAGTQPGSLGPNGIFKTTDGGLNWEQLTNGIPATINPNQISIVHTATEHVIYMGSETTNSGVYKSLNGGSLWTKVLNQNVNAVVIDPTNSAIVYVGTWNNTQGFLRSVDGSDTWTTHNEGLPLSPGIESIVLDPLNPKRVLIGTTSGVWVRTFPP